MSRHTVRDAAHILGITTGAVRNRLSRGTLRSIKEGGTVYVLLPERDTRRHTYETPHDMSGERDVLISEMRGRIDDLRGQLEAEREANRENRRIIAALTSRIPELEAPPAPRDAPQTPAEGTEGAEPRPTTVGVQEGSEQRARWWHRWFGG